MNQESSDNQVSHKEFEFWQLALIITLLVALFPWSIIFCIFYYGWEETVLLFRALVRDMVSFVIALIVGLIGGILLLIIGLMILVAVFG